MTPAAALAEIWHLGRGEPAALGSAALAGAEPALPSSFAVGTMAQATIAASALAAAEFWRRRTGERQAVAVAMRDAAIEFRSERYLRVPGTDLRGWDKVAGVYRTGDGRHVRLHTNFPHHRAGMLAMLGADYERASVASALERWQGEAFETAAAERGLVATMTRTPEEWAAHAQGQAVARLPLYEIIRIGDAPPRPLRRAPRPLEGVRVLDLTRVIAGPVCGRTLAAHGADVLQVSGPKLPFAPSLVMDTGRGKRATFIELTEAAGRETLARLARAADIFVQGYRPGAIASYGFAPERLAELSPGIVCVSLSAYGHEGPWAGRRGFDSLVQNANGLNHAEAVAAGVNDAPKELPAQALDHGSGYLMATGAMLALKRQREVGGSWLVRVSLAQTGHWFWRLGRLGPAGHSAPDPTFEDVADRLETTPSGFGPMTAVRHAAQLSATPAAWALPSVPLGTHAPEWAAA
jgi:crotonobetainyl-CoA:carnitine CoA-transferase CaiB-like acyl-CoA transferase